MAAPGAENSLENATGQNGCEWYEKLYLMLLDAIPCSVLLVDRALRVVTANNYFLEKSRRSASQTFGCHLREVFPSGILERVDVLGQVSRVVETGTSLRGQRITYRAPGIPVCFYYYSALPVTEKNGAGPGYALLVMEDVTEQVRLSEHVQSMERQLANVVEHATDIIASTDTEARIRTWNVAAERLSGYALEQVCGRSLLEYVGADARDEFRRSLDLMARSDQPQMSYADLITARGDRIPVSWVCSPIRDGEGCIRGAVAVGRDMTGAKQFEAQLLQSQKLAALGVMAGGIAHELRNPLTLCSSGAQFLLEDDLTAEFRKECAEQIRTGIERASLVIENLLRFASPGPHQLSEVNIGSVVEKSLGLVDNLTRLQRIDLVVDLGDGPFLVRASETLLEQVFINLLLNAIDAMPDGGIVRVSVKDGGAQVSVSVTDTGCGIAADEINRIFDPFYTRFSHKKGTGLGLSVCYSIIKQLEGAIQVTSTEGRGSTFVVTLPLLA